MIFYLCSYSDFFNNKDEDNSLKTLNDKKSSSFVSEI